MNPAAKLLKADLERKTRLHDLKGNLIDIGAWPNIPKALTEAVIRTSVGYRRTTPWISYRATRRIQRLMEPDWRVLEFGSGASTIWFAARCQFVLSIESKTAWYEYVRSRLAQRGLTNVQLELRPVADCTTYPIIEGFDQYFDFLLIDGDCRSACVAFCLRKVKPGGYVYLDNTDKPGDLAAAEAAIVAAKPRWHRYYVDFAPGLAAPTQGLLVRL